jgi:hypothetical protein
MQIPEQVRIRTVKDPRHLVMTIDRRFLDWERCPAVLPHISDLSCAEVALEVDVKLIDVGILRLDAADDVREDCLHVKLGQEEMFAV